MTDPVQVNHLDLVRLQVQLRCFNGYSAGNLSQFIPRATHNRPCANARWWTVSLAQATLIGIPVALELMMWQVAHRSFSHLLWGSTSSDWSAEPVLPQPIGEPSEVAVAIEGIRGEIQVAERHQIIKRSGHHTRD